MAPITPGPAVEAGTARPRCVNVPFVLSSVVLPVPSPPLLVASTSWRRAGGGGGVAPHASHAPQRDVKPHVCELHHASHSAPPLWSVWQSEQPPQWSLKNGIDSKHVHELQNESQRGKATAQTLQLEHRGSSQLYTLQYSAHGGGDDGGGVAGGAGGGGGVAGGAGGGGGGESTTAGHEASWVPHASGQTRATAGCAQAVVVAAEQSTPYCEDRTAF